jgi:hypothetical protein
MQDVNLLWPIIAKISIAIDRILKSKTNHLSRIVYGDLFDERLRNSFGVLKRITPKRDVTKVQVFKVVDLK